MTEKDYQHKHMDYCYSLINDDEQIPANLQGFYYNIVAIVASCVVIVPAIIYLLIDETTTDIEPTRFDSLLRTNKKEKQMLETAIPTKALTFYDAPKVVNVIEGGKMIFYRQSVIQCVFIAFGHTMRSGKDTAVSHLIKKYGGQNVKFASPIYDIVSFVQQKAGMTVEKDRNALRFVGQQFKTLYGEDIWVRMITNTIESSIDNCIQMIEGEKRNLFIKNYIYISDLRFKNEFAALRDHGFALVDINPTYLGKQEKEKHISERDLDDADFDYTVENHHLPTFLETISSIHDYIVTCCNQIES